jgi:ACS family allantoate permease-like MFS transporter
VSEHLLTWSPGTNSAMTKQHRRPKSEQISETDPSSNDEDLDQKHDISTNDVAANFLHGLDHSVTSAPVTTAESRKLLRKIDWILIPLLGGTVILAAVDKVITSNAAIYGMTADTHLVGQQYSWVGSIFYFGYLVAEFPAAYLVQRLPVAKLLACCVASWGVLMMCIAATQNFAGLATVRFLFGMAEVPAFIIASIITAMWWTTAEQPIRIAFWFNQVSSHHSMSVWFRC